MANEQTTVTPASFMATVLSWIGGGQTKLTEAEAKAAQLENVTTQLAKAQADVKVATDKVAELSTQCETLMSQAKAVADREAAVGKREKELEAEVENKANLLAGQKLSKLGVGKPVVEIVTTNPSANGVPRTWTEKIQAAVEEQKRNQQ